MTTLGGHAKSGAYFNCTIGAGTTLGENVSIAPLGVVIGANCVIGDNVKFWVAMTLPDGSIVPSDTVYE